MGLYAEGVDHERRFLSSDLLGEILSRVDALTLAKASCASSEFRRLCASEAFWERLCNLRWPSTKQAAAKDLILQTGGYRKFCENCHPCLSGTGTATVEHCDYVEGEEVCPSDFSSIIDVMYNGQVLVSRTIAGFFGAEKSRDWFDNSPFMFDLLEGTDEVNGFHKDDEGITAVAIQTELSSVSSAEGLWKALNENMTVSWILVNKKTGRMVNLASWKPVDGLRHWPCDGDFVLQFGTVIPSTERLRNHAVHCNVAAKVRHFNVGTADGGCKPVIGVTEVGMKLENIGGARLNGRESVALLDKVLSCNRTVSFSTVLHSHREFHRNRVAWKTERIRQENQRELTVALISGVGAFLCLCYCLS
nr:F-box GID2-like protein [Physcomitrium patens]